MKVFVVGRTGQLARELAGIAWPDGIQFVQAGRDQCDLGDPVAIADALLAARPDVVVNAAAYTAVDRAETEPEIARRINAAGPAALACGCAELGAALVHVSTDYVFDGRKNGAYREDDPVNPLSVYGRTKLEGERAVRDTLPRHVIIRTSWVFSAQGSNFVKTMLRIGPERGEVRVVADQFGSPTSARHIAQAIATIVTAVSEDRGTWGTFHFASAEPVSWFDFARAIFDAAELPAPVKVSPITAAEFGAAAQRPANSVLDCARIRAAYGIERPSWRAALNQTLAELETAETP